MQCCQVAGLSTVYWIDCIVWDELIYQCLRVVCQVFQIEWYLDKWASVYSMKRVSLICKYPHQDGFLQKSNIPEKVFPLRREFPLKSVISRSLLHIVHTCMQAGELFDVLKQNCSPHWCYQIWTFLESKGISVIKSCFCHVIKNSWYLQDFRHLMQETHAVVIPVASDSNRGLVHKLEEEGIWHVGAGFEEGQEASNKALWAFFCRLKLPSK